MNHPDDLEPPPLSTEAKALLRSYERLERPPPEVDGRVHRRVTLGDRRLVVGVAFGLAAAAVLLFVWLRPLELLDRTVSDASMASHASPVPSEQHAGERADAARRSAPRNLGSAKQVDDPAPFETEQEVREKVGGEPPFPEEKANESARSPAPKRGRPSVDRASSSLRGELKLLRRAQRALADGNPQLTLSVLEQLARSHPEGALAEERDALRIIALCHAGKRPQARGEARVFGQRYPSSGFLPRVEEACRE